MDAEEARPQTQLDNPGHLVNESTSRGRLGYALVVFALIAVYSVPYLVYRNAYHEAAHVHKYDISSEVFRRVLFTGDVAGINEYILANFGYSPNLVRDGFDGAIADERPLWFLFMSVMKLVQDRPIEVNYVVCVILMLVSICLLLRVWAIEMTAPRLFIACALPSPFLVYHCFLWEPHVLEAFLTACALFFYKRDRIGVSFFLASISVFAHLGNIPLVGCLFLYHVATKWRENWAILTAIVGGLAGWGVMELFLSILFSLDSRGIMPHDYEIVRIFCKSSRPSAYLRSPALTTFLRASLMYLPLCAIGLGWIRDRLHFAVGLGPLLVYLLLGGFSLPGAYRVFLPAFLIGYSAFFANLFETRRVWMKRTMIVPIIYAVVCSFGHYAVAANALDLRRGCRAAFVCEDDIKGSAYMPPFIYWNLARFGPVDNGGNAPICYRFCVTSALKAPTIPFPKWTYHYMLRRVAEAMGLDGFMPKERRIDIDVLHRKPTGAGDSDRADPGRQWQKGDTSGLPKEKAFARHHE